MQFSGHQPVEHNSLMLVPEDRNGLKSNGEENGRPPIELKQNNVPVSKVSSDDDVNLKRRLGLFSAVNLIISVMIGSGIFVSPSSALKRSGSVGLSLVVWASCGGISLLGALAFAELGIVVPKSGAEYSYFRAAFSPLHKFLGPLPCFLYIWVVVWILRPAEVAIIILTFAEYVCEPLITVLNIQLSSHEQDLLKKLTAALALGIITYINFRSVKIFMKIQNVLSSCKIVVCIIVIIGGIYELCQGNIKNLNQGFQGSKVGIKDIVLAIYSGLWAYDGWSSVTIVAEEIKKPNVNIPRSILIGVPLITSLYTMMNVAYMTVLSIPEMISVPAVAVAFGDKILGKFNFIIPIGVALSTFSCSMSVQFGVSRLCFAAGREGHMIEAASYIHVRRYTPAPAVGLQVPIIIPILLAVLSGILAGVPIVTDPAFEYIAAVLFMGVGVLVYYPLVYKKWRFRCMDKFNYLIQVLMEVAPPTNCHSS